EMSPPTVIRHPKIGITPPRDRSDPFRRRFEPLRHDPEMPGLAALGGGEDTRTALAHRRGAEQVLGFLGLGFRREAHASRARPLVRRNRVALGGPAGAKYPAAIFAAISTCASGGTMRSGIATCSMTLMPCASSASCFMFDIDTQRSMRLTPSQWNTSGISSWNRMSWTPATHSVRWK